MAARIDRPDLFVPLSVRALTGQTGTRIYREFGREGQLAWIGFLLACKLNVPEGEIHYASEQEGFDLLGIGEDPPGFTLDAFFRLTGRIKQTKRTRSGRVSYVICTTWGRWNDIAKRERERERKARLRHKSKRDTVPEVSQNTTGQEADKARDSARTPSTTDFREERELEIENPPPPLTEASYPADDWFNGRPHEPNDPDQDLEQLGGTFSEVLAELQAGERTEGEK